MSKDKKLKKAKLKKVMTWSPAEAEARRSQHLHTSAQRERVIILRSFINDS